MPADAAPPTAYRIKADSVEGCTGRYASAAEVDWTNQR
jgi:hypothetical protein